MKPNIALSLSFEGIGLLCRVPEGWHVLGEVALGAADLASDLRALRDMAARLEGPDFSSKLVLPNDQIKYLELDTGRLSKSRRQAAAIAALEESTPYQAADLAFVLLAQGRKTHVAAVTRETLAEAEAFAVEHQFNPVCFVAIPPQGGFPAEPVFGLTTAAQGLLNGAALDPNDAVIEITGAGPLPALSEPPPAPVGEPRPDPAPATPDEQPEAQATETQVTAAQVTAAQVTAAQESDDKTPAGAIAGAAEGAPPSGPRAAAEADKAGASSEKDGPAAAPESLPDAEAEPVSAFSSIRARRDAPPAAAVGSAGRGERSVAGTNAPGLPAATLQNTPHAEAPLHFDPAAVIAGFKSDPDLSEQGASNGAGNGAGARGRANAEAEGESAPRSFFSRHRGRAAASEAASAKASSGPANGPGSGAESGHTSAPVAVETERHRMTLFGARDGAVRGKPRHLGLMLTLILLLFLAGVALWASLFLDEGLAGLLRREPVPQIAELEVESTQIEAGPVETAALAPVDSDSVTDSAEIEALAEAEEDAMIDSAEIEAESDPYHPTALSEIEAEARYAATGIWQRAPRQSATPPLGSTDTLYVTSIDRLLATRDAVALAEARSHAAQDWRLPRPSNPAPAGTRFDLDERGLVRATAEGAMSPGGIMVYLGRPAALPTSYPERKPAPGMSYSPEAVARFAVRRPRVRPDNLVETNQRASYGGRTLDELASIRPRLRPELAKAEGEKETAATEAAVLVSARPRPRPSDFAATVARATPSQPTAATPAAAAVAPTIPSSASVARQATIQNAINLNKISLIGVYGTTSSRRALVRLSNGRFKKVQVGDRIDGGQVAAISDTELHYVKSGKNVVLKMPKG